MIKVAVLCPDPKDATSFYRGVGPISHLKRVLSGRFEFNFIREFHWASLALECDILYLQRPFTEEAAKLCEMAKGNNKKIWVDYDDNLFLVPQSNPTHRVYGSDKTKKAVAKCTTMADHVSVSTQAIADFISPKLNKNVTVVPNAFMDNLVGHLRPEGKLIDRRAILNWRGSGTHDEDLMAYGKELVDLSNEFPKWLFNFIGAPFWLVTNNMNQKNLQLNKAVDPITMFETFIKVGFSAQLVPLAFHAFNQSKSNIAWIEASFAGAVSLVPDMPEWTKPGALVYENPLDFRDKVRLVAKREIDVVREAALSWEYIQDNLLLSDVNMQRIEILESLAADLKFESKPQTPTVQDPGVDHATNPVLDV